MSNITGLHHVTAIAGPAQENLDFYAGILGMQLVKKSVNQDDPSTYHLFYADGEGHAGSDLTFFPWAHMRRGRDGTGLTNEVSLAVPAGSLAYWNERLTKHDVKIGTQVMRFGERALPFTDVHGLALALVETSDAREFTPWGGSPVPIEHQIRGLHTVRISERNRSHTEQLLEMGMGFKVLAEENGWKRYALGDGGSGRILDVEELPSVARGAWGTGRVHHVAWRVDDDAAELAARTQLHEVGTQTTEVIDRIWFKSVYFSEPGGALFELATVGPGFEIDESADALGTQLILPPWLEPARAEIEKGLPVLAAPAVEAEVK
ncbi:MAG: ring-cleaving dioxygenase [Gemmatimonadaceae bacterium]|nr:ring-cleaving dioxygenase [Gemmatimonadaceae bacterium]